MATYIAQFNEYTHKVQTLKVSSNFKVATALTTAGDYKRIYDLLRTLNSTRVLSYPTAKASDAHHTR